MASHWKDRRVLITGGAGFIGSNLARRLVSEGARVRVADNLERGALGYLAPIIDRIEFQKLDLRERSGARQAVEGSDVVFHLAAKVAGMQVYLEHGGSILTNNLSIDQTVFAAMLEAKVSSLFYASSSHVYPGHRQQSPDSPPLRETEAFPADPAISYGWGKVIGEVSAAELARENPWLRVSIARICGAYGYNQDIGLETGSLIPVLCHRAARWPELKPFRVKGTGKETRSYCFIDDVVEALLRSVQAQEKSQVIGPFNLGREEVQSVHGIADDVIRASGKPIEIEFDPSAATPLWSQTVNCSLAHALLDGWEPRISLSEGIRLTYRHVEERVRNL